MTSFAPRRRRRRGRREPSLRAKLVVGLVVVAVLAAVFQLAASTPDGVPGVSYRTAYADLPETGSLKAHDAVKIAGSRIGQVRAVRRRPDGVRLELQLRAGTRLPADTSAVVRSQGLLGLRYLQLIPGTSRDVVADGGQVRAARNAATLGVPDALETFDRATRDAMGQTIRALGEGTAGRGAELNPAIGQSPTASRSFHAIADAVTATPGAAERLVPSLAAAAGAVDRSRDRASALLDPADGALRPFVDRRDDVHASLDGLPPALASAEPAFAEGRALVGAVTRLATAADRTLPGAPGGLRAAARLLVEARAPLRRADGLVRQAESAVPPTLRLTDAVRPVLVPLKQPLDELTGPVETVGRYGCNVVNFARNWRSFLGFGIPSGGRIGPLGEIRAEAIVGMPFAEAGPALRLPDVMVDRDPYPAPCTHMSTEYSLLDPTK